MEGEGGTPESAVVYDTRSDEDGTGDLEDESEAEEDAEGVRDMDVAKHKQ